MDPSPKDNSHFTDASEERNGDATYHVGYGRPPLHSRFKSGQSGNPRGRPKHTGTGTVKEELQDLYLRELTVRDGDKKRKIPGILVLLQKLLTDGIRGDRGAAFVSYKLAQQLGVLEIRRESSELDMSVLTKEERAKCSEALEILRKARSVKYNVRPSVLET